MQVEEDSTVGPRIPGYRRPTLRELVAQNLDGQSDAIDELERFQRPNRGEGARR